MHECSIIHRDLKPENILITAKRHIMLSDFGTAKIIGAEVGMGYLRIFFFRFLFSGNSPCHNCRV